MKYAIVGSRSFSDLPLVRAFVRALPAGSVVVSGGAKGVDYVAADTALICGFETLVFPADWRKFGRSAGAIRNKQIVNACDLVIAFWDGSSRGTALTIALADSARKPVFIVREV